MMDVEKFVKITEAKFFAGVPDSQLRALCDYLLETYGVNGSRHKIAANEGNAVGLAAGFHLATKELPMVYLQNSGIGNIINPVASLMNPAVYGIPCLFVIGWRGEPGVHDEPQHVFQGKVTENMLASAGIEYRIFDKETGENELRKIMRDFIPLLQEGRQCAFLVRKGGLTYLSKDYKNDCLLHREQILEELVKFTGKNVIVSTTGKTSRELFEIRERRGETHEGDFLTVGSMGHATSIALGIALQKPEKKVYCIDGDGAALMHMGAIAVIGTSGVLNFVHVIINNGAHESVGGQPNAARYIDWPEIARACGYTDSYQATNLDELKCALQDMDGREGCFLLEVKAAIGARENLGRPTKTPIENKTSFMKFLH